MKMLGVAEILHAEYRFAGNALFGCKNHNACRRNEESLPEYRRGNLHQISDYGKRNA